ncbi:PREDICTED: 5'-nucleotidase domain-containing protein 3-like [Priapulus caudatus]|uniref:5'-nucleotidase domain-containing protein 3-like n=1 Tax=Priapulus caudatus TaxID=37621 RepID=A0ABM1E632_PRICU|nr:PREDICTED: 5'-nucleotidase domain-containing protein 3-like [Priapulus caudatus]
MAVSFSTHVSKSTATVSVGRLIQAHLQSLEKNVRKFSVNRRLAFTAGSQRLEYWQAYERAKTAVNAETLLPDINPKSVFANNELCLADIDVYGFDYDFTLALYNNTFHELMYKLAIQILIEHSKYPTDIVNLEYDPNYAIRGLHYDIHKGLIMKIDAFHKIQTGTVFRGHRPVSEDEIRKIYGSLHVPLDLGSSMYGFTTSQGSKMRELLDKYSLVETCLLSDITELFICNDISYDPDYLFDDVRRAIEFIHTSRVMHNLVKKDFGLYVNIEAGLPIFLKQLKEAGKSLFVITNSHYDFVDAGMRFQLGDNWLDYFDTVITQARKPHFFIENNRPFRVYDRDKSAKGWGAVTKLVNGNIYCEGNIDQFKYLTGWQGESVLYFGDHVYSDLADPAVKHGWRTGAIIPELENEIQVINDPEHNKVMVWMYGLKSLLSSLQHHSDRGSKEILQEWLTELAHLKQMSKDHFNPRFGSMFRTFTTPSFFARRLGRFADIYTSSVVNLSGYSSEHVFYVPRSPLPHEFAYSRIHFSNHDMLPHDQWRRQPGSVDKDVKGP